MSESPKHSVSVAGVVRDTADRVLVIRRSDNGRWEPPGGVLELNETFEDGVRREIAEETGVEVAVDELSGVYKHIPRGVVALVFRCRAVGGVARATEEAREVRWITHAEIGEYLDPVFAIRVFDAFEPGAKYRAHDGVRLMEG